MTENHQLARIVFTSSTEDGTDATALGNRRCEFRVPVNEHVRISLGGNLYRSCLGSVKDCSDHGLTVFSLQSAEIGESVLVKWDYGYFAGAVRNIKAEENGWRLGIELEPLVNHPILVADLQRTALP